MFFVEWDVNFAPPRLIMIISRDRVPFEGRIEGLTTLTIYFTFFFFFFFFFFLLRLYVTRSWRCLRTSREFK